MALLLAGLSGCEPSLQQLTEQQLMEKAQDGDGEAAVLLAKKRQKQGDLHAALNWYKKAVNAGQVGELEALLSLEQRQHGFLAAASYLQGYLQHQQSVTAAQMELAGQYGVWNYAQLPVQMLPQSKTSCSLTLQPIVQSEAGSRQWALLQQKWQQDPQLSALSVCFLAEQRINSTELQCSYQPEQRIECLYQVLMPLVAMASFNQLLVVAGEGKANYNNGIVQLAETSSFEVFRHEFAHILGFIDEYSLSPQVAATECSRAQIRPNLLTHPDQLEAYLKHWQLQPDQVQLHPVETCTAAGVQAYAPVSMLSFMRSHESAVPELYLDLMQKVLARPELIMPVQYFYAYLARQRQDWSSWRVLMQHAAAHGYPDAKLMINNSAVTPTAP